MSQVAAQDLAVAHYVLGRMSGSGMPFLDALKAADLAIEGAPNSAIPLFNRALVLESLGLIESAKRDWAQYLHLEEDQLWKLEAREHVHRLELSQDAKTDEAGCPRLHSVHEALLDNLWQTADLQLPAKSGVAREHVASSRIPSECLPDSGSSLVARELSAWVISQPKLRYFQGIKSYRRALEAFDGNDIQQAETLLALTRELLGAERTELLAWLMVLEASLDVYRDRNNRSVQLMRRVLAEEHQDPWLTARAHWIIGLATGRQGKFADSFHHYQAALEAIASKNEPVMVATLQQRSAEVLDLLNRQDQAWESRINAIQELATYPTSRAKISVLWEAAFASLSQDRPRLAMHYLDELGRHQELARSQIAHQIPALRAEAFARLSRYDEAEKALAQAHDLIADGAPSRAQDHVVRAEASVRLAKSENHKAIRLLTQLLRETDTDELAVDHLKLRTLRASAFRSLGDSDSEERDLRAVVDVVLAMRSDLRVPIHDRSFSASVAASFTRLIQLTARRPGGVAEALEYLDASRSYRMTAPIKGLPDDWDLAAARQLRHDTAIVAYALWKAELLVWTLDRTQGLHLDRQLITPELHSAITACRRRGPDRSTQTKLFRLLLEPVVSKLPHVTRLLLLGDASISQIPFGILRKTPESPPVITRLTIAHIPRLFRDHQPPTNTNPPTKLFAVGIADPPRPPFDYLPALRGATEEVARVTNLYPGSRPSLAAGATVEYLRQSVEQSDIFHFAGHAISNGDDPLLSYLLFSSDTHIAPLSGEELGTWDLSGLRAVVLSACNTSHATANGLVPLGVPLLEAGAAAVIGNRRPVADDLAPAFVEHLHRHLARGRAPEKALQLAQIEAMRRQSTTEEGSWADWIVLTSPPLLRPNPQTGDTAKPTTKEADHVHL